MSEWWTVLAIFWIAYLLDGIRRRNAPLTIVRRTAPWPALLRHAPLHLPPPAPWTWRACADDPPAALSPDGLCNQPLATAARPADRAPFTAVWRWEQIDTVAEKDGWLVVNGKLFAPAAAAWPAAELLALAGELKPLDRAARAPVLRRRLDQRFRPAHWRRRLAVLRRRTGSCARLNTAALAAFAAVSAIVVFAPPADAFGEVPRVFSLLSPLLLCALLAYLAGIAAALVAARRLRRWLRPGATRAIISAAFFPPQGLRWRRLLTDLAHPAPHPLLLALAAPGRELRRTTAFDSLADARWPLPLPELARGPGDSRAELFAAAAEIRVWHAAEFERRFRAAFAREEFTAESLLAPPAADNAACVAYCPRCRSQFVRREGRCPHRIALQPLPPRE